MSIKKLFMDDGHRRHRNNEEDHEISSAIHGNQPRLLGNRKTTLPKIFSNQKISPPRCIQ